jgi:putative SOS response-associated peptidase YedK
MLTTKADGDLAVIHDRRPLALRDEDAKSWIETVPSSSEKVVFGTVSGPIWKQQRCILD